ncbi:MAG: PIN domain-containing protein, partial [Micrococcales bacterium]|nr:PIN domain-containing protein [Micrococcales bacterium]
DGQIVLTPPVVLELGFATRNPAEWEALHERLAAFPMLPMSADTHRIATDLQRALWRSGKVRAAGAFDTLVAALAIEYHATVLHYDADYSHLATVSTLRQAWAVPRGSVP